tara:strand:- start:12 stop:179 length:168 start_codon:yes stop_codon:yes gene_type:complete
MLVINTYGRLIHVISEDNKQKYRIPIQGVITNKDIEGDICSSSWGYNKKMKWLYK